jgi:hypothetical protein
MIRILVSKTYIAGLRYIEAAGLSTESKPTEGIVTGSKFHEVDTGIDYSYDEVSRTWTPQNSGNGKTSIAGAVITLGTALKYTGSEQTQAVSTVKLGNTTLTANTDYELSRNTGTEIGDYELVVIGKGSYAGAAVKAWSITQGDGSVSASPDSLSLTEGGDAGSSTLTVTGDGAVTVESSNAAVATVSISGTTVTVIPVAEGSATVTVSMAETVHYSAAEDTISVTVAAADDDT